MFAAKVMIVEILVAAVIVLTLFATFYTKTFNSDDSFTFQAKNVVEKSIQRCLTIQEYASELNEEVSCMNR